jgi:phospholipid-binding lipoprotein MlaA
VSDGRLSRQGWRRIGAALLCAALLGLSGCANLISQARMGPGQKLDPWEAWNRKVFTFNERLDKAILKPVATAYRDAVPGPVRQGVDNFFNNIADAWSAVNLFLQGRWRAGIQDTARFAFNTTLGLGGVLDVAGEAGLEHHYEDLGKTFGRWGFKTGAYIVWPVFGPSSVRDTLAMPWDRMASAPMLFDDGSTQVGVFLLQSVNSRANLLRASQMLEDIALDKYTFIRDAYLTKRGSIGEDDEDDELKAPPATDKASPPQEGW